MKCKNKGLRPIPMTFLRGRSFVNGYYYYHKDMEGGVYPLVSELKTNIHKQSPAFQKAFTKLTHRLPHEEAMEVYGILLGESPSLFMSEQLTREVGESVEAYAREDRREIIERESHGKYLPETAADRLYVSHDMTAYQSDEKDEITQKMLWKMAKIAVVYDENRSEKAVHDKRVWKNGYERGETTYCASVEDEMTDIGEKLYAEALRRGLTKAREVIFISDGAAANWNLAETHFQGAVQILDWYHACGYLTKAGNALYGENTNRMLRFRDAMETLLWEGKVEEVNNSIENRYRSLRERLSEKRREEIETTLHYYENNRERMRYASYRARGYDIGSGSVESACRQIVGKRIKSCCMFWDPKNVASVLAIRTSDLSCKYDAYWENLMRKAA